MTKVRMEAFSDGVIAIIITIMVLELKVPHEATLVGLLHIWPHLLSYVLSFLMIGTYWNNHHHLLHVCSKVTGGVLWANLHLLFWLSVVPFLTEWMAETFPEPVPVAFYGGALMMAGVAYYILAHALIAGHGKDSALAAAMGGDVKGKISVVLYALGIGLCFLNAWLGCLCYLLVAALWLIPDRRIEHQLHPK